MRILERQTNEGVSTNGGSSGNRSHCGAHLVRERNVVVTRSLRDELRTRGVERMELVRQDTFEGILDRLLRQKYHRLINFHAFEIEKHTLIHVNQRSAPIMLGFGMA